MVVSPSFFLPQGAPGARKCVLVRSSEMGIALLSSLFADFWGCGFSTHFLMRVCIDFDSQNEAKIEPKSIKNLTFSSIGAASGFSDLKSLLKLIFVSTAGPANLDFEATLWHFLMFFRFSENRIEDDFEVIFDLPTAPKNCSSKC